MDRPVSHSANSATLRGARAVGIVCAILFFLPVVAAIAFPSAFLFAPYHRIYERMIASVLFALGLGLLLAIRDPGMLVASSRHVERWIAQVPILAAVSATLVVTYTRLRRPHPVVVRIVVAAVVLLPFAFFLHDLAYATFVAGR